ncbi:MAG: hypothetical protein M1382_02375 [Candidatus Marsarchaeota archaeon]|jgi:hypothetical protein|nr:hypothetical protein [Candidatus Marsarchaeota archaeon]
MSETMTVNVKEDIASEFRKQASIKYGKKKGYLGKALTEAMQEWSKQRKDSLENQFLELLETGIKMKKWKFDRAELHER